MRSVAGRRRDSHGRRVIVLAVAGALTFAAVAAAKPPLTITVRTKLGPTVRHPHPPANEIGDTFVSSLTLVTLGWQFGKAPKSTVGTMQFTYTLLSQCTAFERSCKSTADLQTESRLPGGTISAAGKRLSIGKSTIVVPIVGGTGRYAGARGTLTMGPSSTHRNVYKLWLK